MKFTDAGDVDLDKEDVRRKDGTRITEADAEQQGENIAARGRVGRPPLSTGAKRSPQVAVRLPEDTHHRLMQKAEAEGRRVSDVVRDAIASYVSGP